MTDPAPTALAPQLWWVPTTASNAYLWRGADGRVLVVDPGLPGDDAVVLDALARVGSGPADVEGIVLTHFHTDHSGAATALAATTGAWVAAGAADAAVLRGQAPAPAPVLTDTERPMYEQIAGDAATTMAPPHMPFTLDLVDGDAVDEDGLVITRAVPGHTWGSVALHVPHRSAVLTGDIAIVTPDGRSTLGPFNVDRDRARAALARLAALGSDVAGVGHGTPLRRDAADTLRHAADAFA